MFDSSGLMAGVFELEENDYRYLLVNPAAADFYGLQPEDMVGRSGRDLGVSEAHIGLRLATLRRCWASGETLTREYPFDHNRRTAWFLGTFSPIPGPSPRVSFVLVDITERKHAQLEAERQQARLDLALRAGGLGLWEFDIERDVIHWDQRTRELFGVEPDAPIDYASYAARLDENDASEIRTRLEAALRGEDGGRYSVVHRAVGRDGLTRWVRGGAQVLFSPDGRATHVLGTVQDVTEEMESHRKQALMVAELNHRVKNNLATVQSIAAQTARRATGLQQFTVDFEGRLLALARTHDVLTQNAWSGAELSVLLERELSAYQGRVRISGPRADLAAGQAVAMALIVHELSTNASKYGALSGPNGYVEVTWSVAGGRLSFCWSEHSGPTVAPPAQRGFGSRLIEKLAQGDLDGSSEATYAASGLVFRLDAPLQT